jgi:hypothetical protein
MTVSIRNWKKFQHFKDRRPPWIKLYRDLLDDPDWHELSGDDAKALVMLWMIASEDEGRLPDARKLAFRLRISNSKVEQLLTRLSNWLIQDDINAISDRYQDDTPETEGETYREEGETETDLRAVAIATRPDDFEKFVEVYPKRDGANPRAPARKKWLAALKAGTSSEDILAAAKRFAEEARSKGQIGTPYIPQMVTWLNQQRWGDYPAHTETPAAVGFYAQPMSREIDAWDQHLQRTEGKTYPRDSKGGWYFPTQWPPEVKEGDMLQ